MEKSDRDNFYPLGEKKDSPEKSDNYYAFGLQTANSYSRENSIQNNFLYNGGTELNATTEVYDLYFRNYDPAIGRMMQVDPMAAKYASQTPYNYAFNDPVYYNDPLGDSPVKFGPGIPTEWERTMQNAGSMFAPQIKDSGNAGGGMGHITPGSGGNWADGWTYSDWSLHGGSRMYRDGLASGLTDIGGRLFGINNDGSRIEAEEVNGELGIWEESNYTEYEYFVDEKGNLRRTGTPVIRPRFVVAGQTGPGDGDIPKHEPFGDWEYFFFGGIDDGILYRKDGTPVGKVQIGYGVDAGRAKVGKFLIQQNGVWKWAVNGRLASKQTLEAAGLLRPSLTPSVGKQLIPQFLEKAEGELMRKQNPGFWNRVMDFFYHSSQFFGN